ncbi:unknown [Bacteroides sp. CAG:927]|jgi:hypothetical protein|nr:unknown [Bacteroides sp. CAG:927]
MIGFSFAKLPQLQNHGNTQFWVFFSPEMNKKCLKMGISYRVMSL